MTSWKLEWLTKIAAVKAGKASSEVVDDWSGAGVRQGRGQRTAKEQLGLRITARLREERNYDWAQEDFL